MNSEEKESILKEVKCAMNDISEELDKKRIEFDRLVNNQVYMTASVLGFSLCPFEEQKMRRILIQPDTVLITQEMPADPGLHTEDKDDASARIETRAGTIFRQKQKHLGKG